MRNRISTLLAAFGLISGVFAAAGVSFFFNDTATTEIYTAVEEMQS